MTSSTVITRDHTQAVQLPDEVRFPEDVEKVEVIVQGRARLIVPAGTRWDSWFDDPACVDDDFMKERQQPAEQPREAI